MIGSDHPIFHMVLSEIPGAEPNDPIERLKNLGWVCFGPTLVENFRCFLPHLPVLRPEKETTKVRTVFDAAMEHEGKSLSSAIRPGPKLQRQIVDILIRFRTAPVALTADIAEMFLQVSLREQHRPYHRFLSTSGISPADIENKINDDLLNVNSWLVTNKLTLNIKKT